MTSLSETIVHYCNQLDEIEDTPFTWFQQLCVNVMKCGPIPRHVAFIMDGNRRFASKIHVAKAEGHNKGYDKLKKCLRWCKELGITEGTLYAFSIENFKRSTEEVDSLMRLIAEVCENLLEAKDKIMEAGLCIRAIGNVTLLSDRLRKLFAEVILLTKDNRKLFLNVAFAYTSRDEIVHSVQSIVAGVRSGQIDVNDITEDLISKCLYTNHSPNPDMIVRTSGEIRFSDYLLWQISNSTICFTKVLWPELSIWQVLACMFQHQRSYLDLKKYATFQDRNPTDVNDRVVNFLKSLEDDRCLQLQSYLG